MIASTSTSTNVVPHPLRFLSKPTSHSTTRFLSLTLHSRGIAVALSSSSRTTPLKPTCHFNSKDGSFELHEDEDERDVHCEVQVISWRERKVNAQITVDADTESVWNALTDYEHLADFIPNLVWSGRIPCPYPGRIWLEQRGFQRAMYWHIEARVVLDLREVINSAWDRELHFSMVDGDFKKFDGKWSVKSGTRSSTAILSYEVDVIPRFNFPAIFLERIIRSDLPVNLRALAYRAERNFVGYQKLPVSENHLRKTYAAINGSSVKKINGASSESFKKINGALCGSDKLPPAENKKEIATSVSGSMLTSSSEVRSNWGVFGKVCRLDRPRNLTLEVKSGCVDTGDDEWFNTSHPFHQMSARELKSRFSHGEEILTSGVDSPELPSSVSRSRGKHYNNKKWEGIDLNSLLDKQKGLSRRGFQQGSSFGQEVKPKPNSNVNKPKGGKLGLAFERKSRGKTDSMVNCSNPPSSSSSNHKCEGSTARSTITSENTQKYREVSSKPFDQKRSSSIRRVSLGKSCVTRKVSSILPQKECLEVSSQPCDQKSRSSSVISVRRSYVSGKASKVEIGGDSTARSMITSENTRKYREVSSKPCAQQSSSVGRVSLGKSCVTRKVSSIQPQKKCLEVSSQPCDQKSRSSSVISVRRSYVLGEASKVESGGDSMRSRGRKSSSGKSSIGSCSNPGYEVKFVSRQQREKITIDKGEVTMNLAVKNRCKPSERSKTSTISVEEAKSGNRKRNSINFAKPAYHRTAKSLVQYSSASSKALLQHTVNKENTCIGGAKEKLRTTKVKSLTAKGKENVSRNVAVNQKCISRGASAGGLVRSHRTTEHNHPQKGDKAGSTALTIVGRDNDQHEAKNQINLAKSIYLR